jgi:hypothetical protein
MKKLMVKVDDRWREVIYVRSGSVDLLPGQDGKYASFNIQPYGDGSEGVTIRSIEDIKLVSTPLPEECKHDFVNDHGAVWRCSKCGLVVLKGNPEETHQIEEMDYPEPNNNTDLYRWVINVTDWINQQGGE